MGEMDEYRTKLGLLSKCTFAVASWPKRFVRSTSAFASDPDYELSDKQKYWIDKLYVSYGAQIMDFTPKHRYSTLPEFNDPVPPTPDAIDEQHGKTILVKYAPDYRKWKQEEEAKTALEKWNKAVSGSTPADT